MDNLELFTSLVSLFQPLHQCRRLVPCSLRPVRKSTAGLSVALFWPTNPPGVASVANTCTCSKSKISNSKKRRLRRKKCKLKAEVTLDCPLDDAHHPASVSPSMQSDGYSAASAIQQDSTTTKQLLMMAANLWKLTSISLSAVIILLPYLLSLS